VEFFRLTCERDLEGIAAKLKHGRYGEGWFKIRSPKYSQREGRWRLRADGAVVRALVRPASDVTVLRGF
jgi:hypothetical protein